MEEIDLDYWEAIGRMASAEDELRDARNHLGEGEFPQLKACVRHARYLLDKVNDALESNDIQHVAI